MTTFLGLSILAWDLRVVRKRLGVRRWRQRHPEEHKRRCHDYYAAHCEELRRRRRLRYWGMA